VNISYAQGVDNEPEPATLDARLLSPSLARREQGLRVEYYANQRAKKAKSAITIGCTSDAFKKELLHKIYSFDMYILTQFGNEKELVEAEETDSNVTTGDTLKIDERVESKGHAKKLAKARLAKANEDAKTASVTMIGDPMLLAGVVVTLGATFGQYAGNYLVHVAVHKFSRGSYTVQLSLKGAK